MNSLSWNRVKAPTPLRANNLQASYSMMLHLGPPSLSIFLHIYYEILTYTFPNSWRFSHVIPMTKQAGRLTDSSAFRLIALTSCLYKVMERMINQRLLFVLEAKSLLSDQYPGFQESRDTMDHLNKHGALHFRGFWQKLLYSTVIAGHPKSLWHDMATHGVYMKLQAHGLRGVINFCVQLLRETTFSVKLASNALLEIFVKWRVSRKEVLLALPSLLL